MQQRIPQVGEQVPDFTLPDTEHKKVSLQDFRGKTVILVFFPAAFTDVCTAELCSFRDNMARLNEANAQVLGISVDQPESLRKFSQEQGLTFPLLSDFDGKAIEAYGLTFTGFHGFQRPVARRAVFVTDPNGTVCWEWLSDNPGQQPDYGQVLQAVDEIR